MRMTFHGINFYNIYIIPRKLIIDAVYGDCVPDMGSNTLNYIYTEIQIPLSIQVHFEIEKYLNTNVSSTFTNTFPILFTFKIWLKLQKNVSCKFFKWERLHSNIFENASL